jgi:hypothetical protein
MTDEFIKMSWLKHEVEKFEDFDSKEDYFHRYDVRNSMMMIKGRMRVIFNPRKNSFK